MTYNLTWMGNVTDYGDILTNVNTLTHGLMGILLVLSIFLIILLININRMELKKILLLNTFISVILSLLLYTIGMFPLEYVAVPIAALVGSIIYYFATD